MTRKRQVPKRRRPEYAEAEILKWADAHHDRLGKWPHLYSGLVQDTLGETWRMVDNALRYGLRGLPGKSSLADLLLKDRGVRNVRALPRVSEQEILSWADAHRKRTGNWPNENCGEIPGTNGENWRNLDMALREGHRGLPGGDTVARLIARGRGVRNRANTPRLTKSQILRWAEAHFKRTGSWPKVKSGPIPEASGETWQAIESALDQGSRGLPGGSSLAKLLAEKRGVRNRGQLPPLNSKAVSQLAKAHWERTGRWPTAESGAVPEAPGETWKAIQMAFVEGRRGLTSAKSLSAFLHKEQKWLESGCTGTQPCAGSA
jgi:hypothetical protein